jgi:splicing factor 3B subunit 3
MHFYNLSLETTNSINCAIIGTFTGTKQELLLLARNQYLELYKIDKNTGVLICLLQWPIFGIIRSMTRFRIPGSQKDLVAIGSDSGRIVLLEYNNGMVHLIR